MILWTKVSVLITALILNSLQGFAFLQRPNCYDGRQYVFSPSPVTRFATGTAAALPEKLDEKQLDFTMGYLNKHHSDVLLSFAETLSELGKEKARLNAWSGGACKILSAKIVDINSDDMELEVEVQKRKKETVENVKVDLGWSRSFMVTR